MLSLMQNSVAEGRGNTDSSANSRECMIATAYEANKDGSRAANLDRWIEYDSRLPRLHQCATQCQASLVQCMADVWTGAPTG